MATNTAASIGVNPVFLKNKDIPDSSTKYPSVLEICLAAEKVSGRSSIVGAQEIRGLWRIYPETKEARTALLVKGVTVRNVVLQVSNTNPYILRDDADEEKPSTKVWIDEIPISVADSEIEHSLVKIGCELRSAIKSERARDADGKLTRFLTGRRFVFITVPAAPLDKTLKVSFFTAKLYHREQRQARKTVICSKCLGEGHHVSACENDIVCRTCKKTGHKRGDPVCDLNMATTSGVGFRFGNQQKTQETEKEKPTVVADAAASAQPARGRQANRVLENSARSRSGTPTKRGRSSSPSGTPTKQGRVERDILDDGNVNSDDLLGDWGEGEGDT